MINLAKLNFRKRLLHFCLIVYKNCISFYNYVDKKEFYCKELMYETANKFKNNNKFGSEKVEFFDNLLHIISVIQFHFPQEKMIDIMKL